MWKTSKKVSGEKGKCYDIFTGSIKGRVTFSTWRGDVACLAVITGLEESQRREGKSRVRRCDFSKLSVAIYR